MADRDFYATVGRLALEAGRLADKLPDLQNSLGLAVCAHQMRQIGMSCTCTSWTTKGRSRPCLSRET